MFKELDFKTIELQPKRSKQKSYYNKAILYNNDEKNITILRSYNTKIGVKLGDKFYLYPNLDYKKHFTATTMRHLRDFLYQHGKKQFIKNSKSVIISNLEVLDKDIIDSYMMQFKKEKDVQQLQLI